MWRVAAVVAVVFGVGVGALTVLRVWLGVAAEPASLGLVGAGLVGASHFLEGRLRRARLSSPPQLVRADPYPLAPGAAHGEASGAPLR